MTNRSIANLEVKTAGITKKDLVDLCSFVRLITGYRYGYYYNGERIIREKEVNDFELALCEKRKVLLRDKDSVYKFIQGFLAGRGITLYEMVWK